MLLPTPNTVQFMHLSSLHFYSAECLHVDFFGYACCLMVILVQIAQLQEERTSLKLHIYQLVESAKQDGDLHQRLLAETKVNLERATTEAEIERRNHKEYVQVLKKVKVRYPAVLLIASKLY